MHGEAQGGGPERRGASRAAGGGHPVPRPSDRVGFEPAYIRIVRTVSERIARGQYRPGDQLPSESQFCAEFDVSPMTLRRAVNMLADRGLVVTAQGRGTFVKVLDFVEASFDLRVLTDRWRAADLRVRLLTAAMVPADDAASAALRLESGAEVVALSRLFLDGDRPLTYHSEYVRYDPRRPLVESQLLATFVDGILDPLGGEGFARARLSIGAVALAEDVAETLARPVGTVALRLEHTFEDFDGSPVSWGSFYLPADEFRLTTTLGADL